MRSEIAFARRNGAGSGFPAYLALAVLAAGGAQAGSLAPPPPQPEPAAPAPAPRPAPGWQGFYAGATLGYAIGRDDEVGHRSTGGALLPERGSLAPEGVNYEIRGGWRGQRALPARSFVYGVELGYGGGDIGDDISGPLRDASVEVDDTVSLRFKSGVTNKRGDMLLYGMFGYVHGDVDYSVSGTEGGDTIAIDTDYTADGFSLGLGGERRLTDAVSINLEWEYVQFAGETLSDSGGSETRATPSYSNIRLGVNYRF